MYRLIRYSQPRATLFRGSAFQNPWTGLESEIDRLFETALADVAAPATPRFPVDLYEDKDNTYVRAELPGVKREDIAVEMVEDYLTINATRKEGEQSFSFSRSITIPESVQADKVSAALENGVLTVTLPKQEQAKPRKIAINVN
ncbi:Hsp20/alpha crystallin family protein [Oleiharenicola sp. Vm1]|uniref:Hsp20/alpha crystallin family protein n=1 Tax=Oleiharenicola sp. Vm1 TaxID=3398393 RepID=UPI0039F5D828